MEGGMEGGREGGRVRAIESLSKLYFHLLNLQCFHFLMMTLTSTGSSTTV